MSLLQRCQDALARPSRLDGRWVVLLALAAYYLIWGTLAVLVGVVGAWQLLGVWGMWPPFADARVITAGMDSQRLGFDPLQENPCDPWNRPMNYPRLWLWPAALGLAQAHTVPVGFGLALAFYGSLLFWAGRLSVAQGVVCGLAVCSPPVMFGVERGNCDLFLFALLASSAAVVRGRPQARPLLYAAVLLASLLKFYPAAGLMVILRERAGRALAWGLGIAGALAAYVLLTLPDLALINRATPRSDTTAYGRMVAADLASFVVYKLTGYAVEHRTQVVASLCGVAVALLLARAWAGRHRYVAASTLHLDGFLLGSGIYTGTFLIGNNWDYRLIFLLLMLPQLFEWVRERGKLARPACVLLAAILVTLWGEFPIRLLLPPAGMALKEAACWLTFGAAAALTMVALPAWLRDRLLPGSARAA